MSLNFSNYLLKENPFPETAVINPLSDNIRINGEIFHEEIFKNEIENLKRKTDQRINVIYITGVQFDRGVGKSALMINHMRQLKKIENSTCVYVKCSEKEKPRDTARKVVEQWHNSEHLWNAFQKAFLAFSKAKNDVLLTPDSVEALFKACTHLPDETHLGLYTHTRDTEKVAKNFSNWVSTTIRIDQTNVLAMAEDYLTKPPTFLDTLQSRSIDPINMYESCLKLLTAFGNNRHYIFLDQFEDIIMGTPKSGMNKFALEMKNIIRTSSGTSTLFITLHPNSEMSLKVASATDMTGLAPLDSVHRINVMNLDTRGDSVIGLAEEYFRRFRTDTPKYTTYPIEPDLLEYICYQNKGLIRGFLQQLHCALNYGASNGYPELTFEFAKEHPLEIVGKEMDQAAIDGFNKHKGRKSAQASSVRGMGKLIQNFKQDEGKQ